LAEGVERCDGDKAAELEHGGGGDGECGYDLRAQFGEESGEGPIECDRPESRAKVFVEDPREVEGEEAHGEAKGDANEEEDERGDGAAHFV
jgi:hypothetical protein